MARKKSPKKSPKKSSPRSPKKTRSVSRARAGDGSIRRRRIPESEKPEPVTGVYDPGAVSSGAPLYLDRDTGLMPGAATATSPRVSGIGWKVPAAFGAAVALVLLGLCMWIPHRTLGPRSGQLGLPGLTGAASIRRDRLGVPFIEATNEDDLFYAVGFSMAQDRLWQMELLKRTAQGRLAEAFGPKLLDFDIYVRTIGLRLAADESYATLPARYRRVLERFSAGVNAYRESYPQPIEFTLARFSPERWSPSDSLAVFAVMKLDLSTNLREELAFLKLAQVLGPEKAALLFPSYPGEAPPVAAARRLRGLDLTSVAPQKQAFRLMRGILGDSTMGASNNWALSPSRTRGNASILANDTHLGISIPSAWMLLNLKCPTYRAAGVAVPGVPLVALGYNGNIAWGATMVMADTQDLFLEQMRESGQSREYFDRGRWRPVTRRRETFLVKGEASVERFVESTRHGPLLNDVIHGQRVLPYQPVPFSLKLGVALRWSNADGDRSAVGFYEMGRARTLGEARRALSFIDSIYLNVVMADRSNIAYQTTGRLPRRRAGRGDLPVPGWTAAFDWDGYLPFGEQPHRMNPPEGFLGTANHRVSVRPPPYHISSAWAGPERMERIRALLQNERSGTLEGTQRMQMDVVSHMALKVRRLLTEGSIAAEVRAAAVGMEEADRKRLADALALIASFDGQMKSDSAAAALFGTFYHLLTRELLQDELGPEDGELWAAFHSGAIGYGAVEDHLFFQKDSVFWDDTRTKEKMETRAEIVARSLVRAVESCEDQMGNQKKWQWGRLHRYEWRHNLTARAPFLAPYLNRGPIAASGDLHTLNITGFKWGQGPGITLIPAMRFVVDFSQADPAFLITHAGQSGNPASPAYDSMLPLFVAGKQHPLPFVQANMDQQYTEVLRLIPAAR